MWGQSFVLSILYLPLNNISYAKAERLKSKKDGRVLPMFRLEINDPTEAEALISQNLVCQATGIVYEVEEFRSSSATNAKVSDIRPKHVGQNKNVSSAERTILKRDAQIEKQRNQNVLTVRDHMLHLTKGVRNTKNRHSGKMWSITKKKHMPKHSPAAKNHK